MKGRYITDSAVTEYIDNLYSPLTPDLGALRRESESAGIPVILKDTERFLSVLVRMTGARRILEIGTAVGYSACCFAEMCGPEGSITTIERDAEMVRQAEENIVRLGYSDRIKIVEGDAAESIRGLDGVFDLVFIDAGKSHYREYWDEALRHCRTGSVIVCDNVLIRGAVASAETDASMRRFRTSLRRMREFLKYISEADYADTSVLAAGDGISVSYIHAGEKDEKD